MSDPKDDGPAERANTSWTYDDTKPNKYRYPSLAEYPTERDWELWFAGYLADAVFAIANAPRGLERLRALQGQALLIGQFVARGEVSERMARDYLTVMAEPDELADYNAVIDRSFRTCRADFVKHFGAGLRRHE